MTNSIFKSCEIVCGQSLLENRILIDFDERGKIRWPYDHEMTAMRVK